MMAALVWLSAAGAGAAAEPDFILRVPVTIADAPHVETARVTCLATANETGRGVAIGVGEASVPLTQTGFDGVVELRFSAAAGRAPQEARGYSCALTLGVKTPQGPVLRVTSLEIRARYPAITGQAIAEYGESRGPLRPPPDPSATGATTPQADASPNRQKMSPP
jgi:hypothetical protein